MPHSFAYLFERFPSFVQTFVYREVIEMLKQGMDPLLLSIRRPDPKELDTNLNLPVHYLPDEKELRANVDEWRDSNQLPVQARRAIPKHRKETDSQRLFEAVWLAPRLRAAKINHIHAHFGGMAARTAWWLKNLYGFTYSFTGHANDIFCPHPYPITNAKLVADAAFIVTETKYAKGWMTEQYPAARAKIHHVFNGIPDEGFLHRQLPEKQAKILSVGRFVEKKGFGFLIEACKTLRDHDIAFECDIVGGGPLEDQLASQILTHKLSRLVRLHGPKTQAEIREMMSEAEVFVLASVPDSDGGSDNLPTVIMEAMFAEVPVVSTDLAGIPEMITHGQTGLLVQSGDVRALVGAIHRILHHRSYGDQLAIEALKSAQAQFDIRKTVNKLKHILVAHEVVAPPGARTIDPSLPGPGIVNHIRKWFPPGPPTPKVSF